MKTQKRKKAWASCPCHGKRRGVVAILAILMLAVLAVLAVSMAASTQSGVAVSHNMLDIQRARLTAESGTSFMIWQLRQVTLDYDTTVDTGIPRLAPALGALLNGTTNLAGQQVQPASPGAGDTTITIPPITTKDGVFQAYIRKVDGSLRMDVEGRSNGISRTVSMGLVLNLGSANSAFNYGIASRGSISVGGSAQILGKNQMTDASIISVTAGPTAVSIGGSAVIDGDVSSVGASTTVAISGSPTVAGSQDPAVMTQHMHFGVAAPLFPTVDTSVFRPLATTVIDSTTDISGKGTVFNNVLIKANTNPTFANDVVLNGVVFVEVPNSVTFTSKVTLNGLIATEQKSGYPLSSCKLSFQGQMEAFGVDALPNTDQFAAVKAMTGTFIVAPGFDVSFAGQFTTINGTVAADRLTFSGQSGGTIIGSVLGLANYPTSIDGTVNIYIDRSGGTGMDAGFRMPVTVDVNPKTYKEL